MVDNDAEPPNFVENIQFVKFTSSEESQYRQAKDGLKAAMIKLVGKKSDIELTKSKTDCKKLNEAMQQLREILISCGEHCDFIKYRNANNKVFYDPKNVIFEIVHTKKREINHYLNQTLAYLYQIAETNRMKSDMIEAASWYDEFANILVDVDELNKRFVQVFGNGDKVLWDEETRLNYEEIRKAAQETSKVLKIGAMRKRCRETKNRSPRKVRKLECEKDPVKLEATQNANNRMAEVKKQAMMPILDCVIMLLHGLSSMEEIESNEEVEGIMRDVVGKLGGKTRRSKKFRDALKQYTESKLKNIQTCEIEKEKIVNDWMKNKDQCYGITRVFRAIARSYKLKNSTDLLIEQENWDMIMPLMEHMSFWPVFINSEQHLIDGQVGRTELTDQQHNHDLCMGVCNKKSVEEISQSYEKSTYPDVLRKMCKFIELLEMMRKELFADYTKLLVFLKSLEPAHCSSVDFRDTLFCNHRLFETSTICIDETSRKMTKKELKCKICIFLHTLAHLRFAIGNGSFHGKEILGTENTIDQLFSMILQIERSKNTEIDGSKELGNFELYMDRLRRTTVHIQSACFSIISYAICMYNINLSKKRVNMDHLKFAFRDKENWPDDQLQDFALNHFQKEHQFNKERFYKACKEFSYMINLFDEGRSQWYKKEDCPVCTFELETFANFLCGHKVCEKCYRELRKRSKCGLVRCVTCREVVDNCNVILARGTAAKTDDQLPDAIPGTTLAVKMNATIHLMRKIFKEVPENENILLLTTFEFRSPIRNYLRRIGIQDKSMSLFTGSDASNAESSAGQRIFVCSFSFLAAGLQNSQAKHIIILDPPQSFIEIEKLIGEHAKTQDVTVYPMIVEESIDEELWKIAKNGEKLTIGKICQILEITR